MCQEAKDRRQTAVSRVGFLKKRAIEARTLADSSEHRSVQCFAFAESAAHPDRPEAGRRRVVEVLPISQHDFTLTPDGSCLTADLPAAGFYETP
jgi:hypothetical protein